MSSFSPQNNSRKRKDVKLFTHSAPAFLLWWGLRSPSRCRLTRWWLFLFFGIYALHLKLLQQTKHIIYALKMIWRCQITIYACRTLDLCLHALTLPDDGSASPLHSGLCVECSLYQSVLPASRTCACSPGSALWHNITGPIKVNAFTLINCKMWFMIQCHHNILTDDEGAHDRRGFGFHNRDWRFSGFKGSTLFYPTFWLILLKKYKAYQKNC